MRKLFILTLIAHFLSTNTYAGTPGWTANSTITRIVVVYDGGINVKLSPDLTGCSSQSGYGPNFASIYVTHPGIDRIQANLLAAYMANKPISLYLSDDRCTVTEIMLGGW